jgi:hypothetical protein
MRHQNRLLLLTGLFTTFAGIWRRIRRHILFSQPGSFFITDSIARLGKHHCLPLPAPAAGISFGPSAQMSQIVGLAGIRYELSLSGFPESHFQLSRFDQPTKPIIMENGSGASYHTLVGLCRAFMNDTSLGFAFP